MNVSKPGLLGRAWNALLATSEAAVAIRYHEPWTACPQPNTRTCRSSASPACAAQAHA